MQHPYDKCSDATLVALTLNGEREAFGPLLLRHYPSVVRLCQRLLGPTFDAQDIAQEAALSAFLNLARLQEPVRFGAWFHAIAANLARMALRRRRPLSLDALADGAALPALWVAGPPAPEDVHAMREIHDAIVAALNELSAVNRAAVIGFYLEGYSYVELAALLGVPVSTLKGRLFFGRKQLRRSLRPLAAEVLRPDRRPRKERVVEQPDLVKVTVDAVRVALLTQHRVVVLSDAVGGRRLPIWIGPFEADAITMALQGFQPQRPLTHDLALRLVEATGAQVQQVVVNRIAENTFFAEIAIAHGEQRMLVDARPSDAIALAVRQGAPIYVARSVLDQAGVDASAEAAPPAATEQTAPLRLLLVGAAAETREQLAALLAATPEALVVAQASNATEALAALGTHQIDAALIATELDGEDGFALAEALLARRMGLMVALMGAESDPATLKRAMQAGAREFLVKPIRADDLLAALRVLQQRAGSHPAQLLQQTAPLELSFGAQETVQIQLPRLSADEWQTRFPSRSIEWEGRQLLAVKLGPGDAALWLLADPAEWEQMRALLPAT